MSLRISLVLIILVSYVGIATAWFIKNPPFASGDEDDLPFFYTLSPDDIRKITVKSAGRSETFTATFTEDGGSVWYFEEPADIPVNFDRWGGITFLLGGPKTQRVIAESFDDPVRYGFDKPTVEISLTLRDGSQRALKLGSATPDGAAHYAQMQGFPQLVLVDQTWGEVLARLVNEPPLPLWYYTFDVAKAYEVVFYVDNDVVRAVSRAEEDSPWVLCDLPIVGNPCNGTGTADAARINEVLEVIAHPQFTRVEKVARTIEEAKHPDYGLDLAAPYLTIRIENVRPNGVTEVTLTSLTLGKLTPDGNEMYVLANEQPTVARVQAGWGTRVKSIFDEDLTPRS